MKGEREGEGGASSSSLSDESSTLCALVLGWIPCDKSWITLVLVAGNVRYFHL